MDSFVKFSIFIIFLAATVYSVPVETLLKLTPTLDKNIVDEITAPVTVVTGDVLKTVLPFQPRISGHALISTISAVPVTKIELPSLSSGLSKEEQQQQQQQQQPHHEQQQQQQQQQPHHEQQQQQQQQHVHKDEAEKLSHSTPIAPIVKSNVENVQKHIERTAGEKTGQITSGIAPYKSVNGKLTATPRDLSTAASSVIIGGLGFGYPFVGGIGYPGVIGYPGGIGYVGGIGYPGSIVYPG